MRRLILSLTFALVATLTHSGVAYADENDNPDQRFGYAHDVVCVSDTHRGEGFRIGYAIRMWNAAQSYVRFTAHCQPGYGTLDVLIYDEHDGRGAYVQQGAPDWQWSRGLDNRSWFYESAEVHFNLYYQRDMGKGYRHLMGKRDGNRALACWARAVAVHEFGHVLGLYHSNRKGSATNSATMKRCGVIAATDVAYLDAIYALRPGGAA